MKIFLIFLLTTSVFAAEKRFFSVGDMLIKFEEVDGFYVNGACVDKKCEAYKKAKTFQKKTVSPELLMGGKNPSAVKCKELMKGKVVIATDREGHQQSLCHFADDSYLQN